MAGNGFRPPIPWQPRQGGGSPRLSSIWRRITGRKGHDIEDAYPVVVLENDRAEYFLSGETRPFLGAASYTPGAGVSPRIQCFNPAGSGVIVIVTKIRPSLRPPSGNGFLTLLLRDTALDTLTTGISTSDTRAGVATGISANRLLSAQIRTAAAAPAGTSSSIGAIQISNTTVYYPEGVLDGPVVLGPGSGIEVSFDIAAHILTVQFAGYERSIESGEEGPL